MPSKEGDAVLPEAIIEGEMERNFKIGAKDEAREHFRFYVDGLVIGLRDKVEGLASEVTRFWSVHPPKKSYSDQERGGMVFPQRATRAF